MLFRSTNYEIKADVVGEEKAKLIQSAKVAFMPYKNESFGIAVLEALRFMPTVVLDKYDWHYNFETFSNYIVADSKEVADIIWSAYNTWTVDEDKVKLEFTQYKVDYENSLLDSVESPFNGVKSQQEPRNRMYTKMKEIKGEWMSLEDYFQQENSKGVIYLTSDIESMYTNKDWFKITHTKEKTFVGIPDDTGRLKFVDKKVSANLSSFFE